MNILYNILKWFSPAPVKTTLSGRALRRLAHTTCRRVIETHRDKQKHVVTRCRLNMAYLDRSKY